MAQSLIYFDVPIEKKPSASCDGINGSLGILACCISGLELLVTGNHGNSRSQMALACKRRCDGLGWVIFMKYQL